MILKWLSFCKQVRWCFVLIGSEFRLWWVGYISAYAWIWSSWWNNCSKCTSDRNIIWCFNACERDHITRRVPTQIRVTGTLLLLPDIGDCVFYRMGRSNAFLDAICNVSIYRDTKWLKNDPSYSQRSWWWVIQSSTSMLVSHAGAQEDIIPLSKDCWIHLIKTLSGVDVDFVKPTGTIGSMNSQNETMEYCTLTMVQMRILD